MKAKRIEIGDLYRHVKIAFHSDKELLEKYHISTGNLSHCVKHTLSVINEVAKEHNLEAYKLVSSEGKEIGFTVLRKNTEIPINDLFSFGINIEYRNQQVIGQWLKWLGKELKYPYGVGLYRKNSRAVSFFLKNGFVEVEQPDEKIIVLIKN